MSHRRLLVAELGFPDFTASTWFGLVARAGTPPEILAKIVDAAKAAHADPAVRERRTERSRARGFRVRRASFGRSRKTADWVNRNPYLGTATVELVELRLKN